MDDISRMLADTMTRLLDAREGEAEFVPGVPDAIAAARLEEFGLADAMVAEEGGGSGLAPADLLPVLRVVGGFLAFTPLAERVLGRWLASHTGASPPFDAVAAPATVERAPADDGSRARGTARRVAWDDDVATVAVAIDPHGTGLRLLPIPAGAEGGGPAIEHTLAGERRATITFDVPIADASAVIGGLTVEGLLAFGAAIRCQLIAGALTRVLDMTLRYVGERRQFGRTLGQFQVIQHGVASMAGEVVAAVAGADAAAAGFGLPPDIAAIAAGKIRCGEAAGKVAAMAHQIHGAMGYAAEYPLHHLTRQLWTWREEWGSDGYWAGVLGRSVMIRGDLWSALAPVAELADA